MGTRIRGLFSYYVFVVEHPDGLFPFKIIPPTPTTNDLLAAEFDEDFYLHQNPDIALAITEGHFPSGFAHYLLHGRMEGRKPRA